MVSITLTVAGLFVLGGLVKLILVLFPALAGRATTRRALRRWGTRVVRYRWQSLAEGIGHMMFGLVIALRGLTNSIVILPLAGLGILGLWLSLFRDQRR